MKKLRALPVHTPCAHCGARGRLWEVKGPFTLHTFCFACRRYREWTETGGSKYKTLSFADAKNREMKFQKELKK